MELFSLSERKVIDYLEKKKPDYLVMFPEWDRYFNFFKSGSEKCFKHIYTPPPFPRKVEYKVFRCNWHQ